MSDLLFTLYKDHLNSEADILYPGDIKSFAYKFAYRSRNGSVLATQALGTISITRLQYESAQAIIMGRIAQPDWVAFIPMPYVRIGAIDLGSKRKKDAGTKELGFGLIPPSMQAFNPLPPLVAPFVMPRAMLPEAEDNFAACGRDPNVKM